MLAGIFKAAHPGLEDATLERRLGEAVARARASAPDLELSSEEFVAYLAEHHQAGAAPLEGVEVESLYLCLACLRGDRRALARFDREVIAQLPAALRQFGDAAFADEILQRLRVRLLTGDPPRLREYRGRGSLVRWARAAAIREATSVVRREPAQADPEDGALERLADEAIPAEARHLTETLRPILRAAIKDAFAALDAFERLELRMYHFEGMDLRAIAAAHRTSVATISRRLARAREALLEATHQRLRERLQLSGTELESVLRAVGTKLGASLFSPAES